MADPRPITRDQLAKFLPDQESIRKFERLFQVAGDLTPTQIQDLLIGSANADAKANAASDSLARIASALEIMASRPDFALPNSIPLDYLDFNGSPPYPRQTRQVAWNAADDTLNIHHSDNVTQQVGQELYARITNNTGFTIPNGTALGIDPTGTTFVKFIADGTLSPISVVGVSTQEILNGAQGRITVWGGVNDLDTTGAPYGETWVGGDTLYVSPTIAGGFTKVKPTATDLSMPIALVTSVHATTGRIFVRPTVEQAEKFGVFSDLTAQTIAAIYTPQAVTFNTTDFGGGISIGSPISRVVSSTSGLYNFQLALQVTSGSASVKALFVWARVNGVDMPNTTGVVTISGSGTTVVPAWNYVFSMKENDYFQIMIAGDSTNLELTFAPAQTGANGTAAFAKPAIPSAILTVTHVAQ